jgi:hypothetical protein
LAACWVDGGAHGDPSYALQREILAAFDEDLGFGRLDIVPVRDQHLSIASAKSVARRRAPSTRCTWPWPVTPSRRCGRRPIG